MPSILELVNQRPATVNPIMARKFAAQRESMAPPTSVMDPRHPEWQKRMDEAENFMDAVDIGSFALLGGQLAPLAVKGAVSLGGKALTKLGIAVDPMLDSYMARVGFAPGITERAPRAASSAEDVALSKIRVGTTGQYVGLPEGIDTPAKYRGLVKRYANAMLEGLQGRNWYDDVSKMIWRRSGENVRIADMMSDNYAVLSQSNKVGGNASMSIREHVKGMTGDPLGYGRFPAQQSELEQIYRKGSGGYKGHKREPFAEQMAVEWAPERVGRGVNDMHEMELMGYSNFTGSATRHAAMDRVRADAIEYANRVKLGGFDDWNTGNAQAAAWTANKIRRGDINPKDAAKHYGDYVDEFLANATHEATPGAVTGHLKGIVDAPFAVRQRFFNDPRSSWTNPRTGGDILYEEQGLMPAPTASTVGRYKDEVNPAFVARPAIATDVNTGELFPGTKNAINATEAFRAYADVQGAGAAHAFGRAPKAEMRSGAWLPMSETTPESVMKIASEFEPKKYFTASNPQGITIMPTWENPLRGKELTADVGSILKGPNLRPMGLKPQWGNLWSTYIDYEPQWALGKGAVTKQMLEEVSKSPTAMAAMESSTKLPSYLLARNARDVEAAASGMGVAREDVLRAREIFANAPAGQRFEALRKAAEQGIVPGVMLGGVSLGSMTQQPDYME